MRIALAHFKDQILQHLRAPGYLLPALATASGSAGGSCRPPCSPRRRPS
jgi:hypothetical protein